jgi:cold shock CspA family protein
VNASTTSAPGGGRWTGIVTAFDGQAGLGTITADDATTKAFHCVAIADGTRTIEVGTAVTFDLIAKLGRYEATDVRPVLG